MSRVVVAAEPRLGRKVVVKVLAAASRRPRGGLAAASRRPRGGLAAGRFEREIRLAGSLQQANIAPALIAGEVGGSPFYAMRHVDGESLRARLPGSPLPVAEAVSVLRDVARVVAYARRQGVVHRDVTPDVAFLSDGVAAVTDLGVAKAIAAAGGRRCAGRGPPAGAHAEGHLDRHPGVRGAGAGGRRHRDRPPRRAAESR